MQLDPKQLAHVLDVWSVGRLATIGPDVAPHLVPIVFVRVDGCIWSPIDGKPKRGDPLLRVRNIARHPSVSLLLDHYAADWRTLWWIRIDGTAAVVTDDSVATPAVPRVVHGLRTKYPQYKSVDLFRGPPTLLRIRPERHTAWSAQPVAWESLR